MQQSLSSNQVKISSIKQIGAMYPNFLLNLITYIGNIFNFAICTAKVRFYATRDIRSKKIKIINYLHFAIDCATLKPISVIEFSNLRINKNVIEH